MCICHKAKNTYHVTCSNQSLNSPPAEIINETGTLVNQENNSHSYNVFQNSYELLHLDLSFNQMQEIRPEDFSELENLGYLNLKNNSITAIHPKAFALLPNLTVLNLACNQLKSLGSAVFIGLYQLQMLDLHMNLIDNISDDAFLYTDSLTSLDLSHNFIRELPLSLLQNLQKLRTLNLTHNHLPTVNSILMKGLKSLQTVDLSNKEIQSFSSLFFPNLENLDLSWNNISTLHMNDFLHISNVKMLNLDGNPIENITSSPLRQLSSLHYLSLSHMPKLYYLSAGAFEGLHKLTVLNLSHNSHLSFIHQDLFFSLRSLVYLDFSFNHVTVLRNATTYPETLTSIDIKGNMLYCDCAIEWLVNEVQKNDSIIVDKNNVECVMPISNVSVFMYTIDVQKLYCGEVAIVNFTESVTAKLGKPVRFTCKTTGDPTAEIIWVTPRKRVLKYYNYHPYSLDLLKEQSSVMDTPSSVKFQETQNWYTQASSYYTEFETLEDRITMLQDGSLYIHYVLRSDAGPYMCIAENPRNSTSVVIQFTLDYQIINEVKIWSIIVGSICAGSFFLLNLIVSLVSAGVRKCVSQRRREQICQIMESMDQYKTAHLTRIKENYNNQVGRIRDQYHYQLGRLREHHHNKVGRIREGASQKVERMRENYNNQLGKLKDYSSNQLVQIRDKYNNQILRIKDYGYDKFERIHEKYRLKQQHVIKLFEMMNLDNCKTVFESECVRTESMILQSDILNADVPLHTPLDSESTSESEYVTATNSRSSSQDNIYETAQVSNIPTSIPKSFTCNSLDDGYTRTENTGLINETPLSGVNETPSDTTVTSEFQAARRWNRQFVNAGVLEGQGSSSLLSEEQNRYNYMILDPSALDVYDRISNVRESSV